MMVAAVATALTRNGNLLLLVLVLLLVVKASSSGKQEILLLIECGYGNGALSKCAFVISIKGMGAHSASERAIVREIYYYY